MLLLLQSCLVCPPARQQENICPTTLHSRDHMVRTSPSLCAQGTEEQNNAVDSLLMCKKVNILKQFRSSKPSLALLLPLLLLIVSRVTSSQGVTSSVFPRSCEASNCQINWHILSSLCVSVWVCVCKCAPWRDKKKKKSECVLGDLWCYIGNQYGSFKSFRRTDWYLQWWSIWARNPSPESDCSHMSNNIWAETGASIAWAQTI